MKFLLVLILLLATLSGCQAGPDELPTQINPTLGAATVDAPVLPTSTAAFPTPTLSATIRPTAGSIPVKPEELRGVQIEFWYAASGDLQQEYEAQIAEFNRSNIWGVIVVGRAFPAYTNLEERLLAKTSESSPQAVVAPMEMLLSWQAQKMPLVSLDAYLHDPTWGYSSQELSDFFPGFWSSQQVNGQIWGLPAGQNAQVLFYNQSWAEELGFRQPPATPAEFRTQACAALKANINDSNPENDGTGGWVMTTDSLALENWRRAFGAEALPVEPGSSYLYNTPASVKAFTFLRKLLDEHCAWNPRSQDLASYFAQRRALFLSASLADLPAQQRAMEIQKSQDRWTVLPYPSEKGQPVVLASGASQAIFQSSPTRQLAAWLFIRFLNLPRVQARLAADASQLPARKSAVAEMDAYRLSHSRWAQSLSWENYFQSLPKQPSWRVVRRMFQDAAWQIMQPFTRLDEISPILAELDQLANGAK